MDKKEVIRILEEIATLLELSGANPFKARAYTNAARKLERNGEDIQALVKQNRLKDIEGIGKALSQKIGELVTTGSLEYYEELRQQFPKTLFELFHIPNLGPKRIKTLYEELGIQSLGELEYACNENRLLSLDGFGKKMQEKILEGIAYARKYRERSLISRGRTASVPLLEYLKAHASIERIELAGSLRRWRETIKDADILASSEDPKALMQHFVDYEDVDEVRGHGDTKASVVLKSGLPVDLRVVSDDQFPYALHYFTGSKEHNVRMRQRAKEYGLKLNEYGLFKEDGGNVCCEGEAAIFEALDLPYVPPELREDMGEFEGDLPDLVEQDDLAGVFHCHSKYSDGKDSLEAMAQAAKKRGYRYIVIADHSQSAQYANGLTPKRVCAQHEEIDGLNKKLKGVRILKAIESDIRAGGSLDYDEDVLESFDLVIASVHAKLNMSEDEATNRLITAARHPRTAILGHPTGRLLLAREGYPVDFERLFDACAEANTAIEVNANPHRLDLDWRHVRRAKEKGVKLVIGPDAHETAGLDDVVYGLGIARKGWLEAGDLLNTFEADALLKQVKGA